MGTVKKILTHNIKFRESRGKIFMSKLCLLKGAGVWSLGYFLVAPMNPLGFYVRHFGIIVLVASAVFYVTGRYQKAIDDGIDFLY